MALKKQKTKIKNRFFLTTKMDLGFLLAILLLNVLGIIMIYSASYYYAVSAYSFAPTYYLFNQLKYVIPGFVLLIAISFFRPFFIKKFWWISLGFTFVLLIAVRIPGIGRASHGAYRWIGNSSFSLQVAEPIKLFMIVFMAGFMIKFKANAKRTPALILMGITSVVSILLFVLSNNLSTAIIVFLMAFFTLMMTYPKTRTFWILIGIAVLIVIGFIIAILVIPYQSGENFRITRIRAWLQPTNEQFVAGEAYQATQALYAISTGGFFGKGLGQSLLKFKLPEPQNDYILAIVFEELGILGVLLLTYLFIYLLYKVFKIYLETEDRFSKYLVLGVFFHLALQILLNYGVTLGFFPTMGVTLPFISAGGSSALFTLMELGMVFSVSKQNAEDRLYKEAREEEQDFDPYYKQLVEEARLDQNYRKGKRVRQAQSTEGEQ